MYSLQETFLVKKSLFNFIIIMKNLFVIFAVIFSLFVSFTAVASEKETKKTPTEVGTIDLNHEQHKFVIDSVIENSTQSTVIFAIYKDGKKQRRTVSVTATFTSKEVKEMYTMLYEKTGYKIPKSFIKINVELKGEGDTKSITLTQHYQYLFINTALNELNIDNR